jgi:thioesterase domain-containing protein
VHGECEPLRSLESMAAHHIREIRKHQPRGPYHLCGYSFGAHLAYEMACQLEAMGAKAGLLILVDGGVPAKSVKFPALKSIPLLHSLASLWVNVIGLSQSYRATYLRHKWQLARARFSRVPQPLPIAKSNELPPQIQAVRAACREARDAYVPSGYGGHIDYIRASDKLIDIELIRQLQAVTSGGFTIHETPGNHGVIMRKPYVDGVARIARSLLNDVHHRSDGTSIKSQK